LHDKKLLGLLAVLKIELADYDSYLSLFLPIGQVLERTDILA